MLQYLVLYMWLPIQTKSDEVHEDCRRNLASTKGSPSARLFCEVGLGQNWLFPDGFDLSGVAVDGLCRIISHQ